MIILKIKKSGYTIEMPGLKTFRSPVEIDISKLDVRIVAMYLKNSGITEYEIVAEKNNKKKVYSKKDFEVEKIHTKKKSNKDVDWEKRFNRLENILIKIAEEPSQNQNSEEQIINKLNELENTIKTSKDKIIFKNDVDDNNPEVEELDIDSFIPEVDISDMTVSSSDNIRKIKQDKDIEDSADLLSGLMNKK